MTEPLTQPNLRSLLPIFGFFKDIWKPFFLSVSLQILLSYLVLYSVESLNIAVSQVDPNAELDTSTWFYQFFIRSLSDPSQIIIRCILIAIGIVLVSMIFDIIVAWSISWSFALLNKKLTPNIIQQLVFSATDNAVKKQEATVIQRWLTIRQIPEFFHNVLANAIGASFSIGIIIWGTYQENLMAGHSLGTILVCWVVLLYIFSPKALSSAKKYALMEEQVGRNIRSTVSLGDNLKLNVVLKKFMAKISPNITLYSHSISLQGFYGSLLYGVLSGLASLAPLVVIIIAMVFNSDKSLGIATAATLYLFASKISSPLATLAQIAPILQSQRIDFVRLRSIYQEQKPSSPEPSDSEKPEFDVINYLRFPAFSYRYSDKKEIHYPDFNLESGKLICLSGKSGVGKTTLMKVLSARLDSDIQVFINDEESYEVSDILNEIAYLTQEPKLAEMSIQENFQLHATKETFPNQYCADAYQKIITMLPDGKNSMVTSDVIGLSVGQRRALSLVNTLALNKKILVLDEPLANIDTELAELLWSAIRQEAASKIILISLHNEKRKTMCDEIITLT